MTAPGQPLPSPLLQGRLDRAVLGRALNGAGCTISTMVFTLVALWGLQVPLAEWLSRVTQPPTLGVWRAIAIATVAHGAMTVAWFETGRWQRATAP